MTSRYGVVNDALLIAGAALLGLAIAGGPHADWDVLRQHLPAAASAAILTSLCLVAFGAYAEEHANLSTSTLARLGAAVVVAFGLTALLLEVTGAAPVYSYKVALMQIPLVVGVLFASRRFSAQLAEFASSVRRASKRHAYFLFDFLVLALAPYAALFIRYDYSLAWDKAMAISSYAAVGALVAIPVVLVLKTHRTPWQHFSLNDMLRIISAVTATVLLALVADFIFSRLFWVPRSTPMIQWAFAVLMMGGGRLLVRHFHRAEAEAEACPFKPDYREHVLVVGANHVAELYLNSARILGQGRIHVVGLLDEDADRNGSLLVNKRVIGSPVDLAQHLAQLRVHGVDVKRVVVAQPFDQLSPMAQEALHHWERCGAVSLDLFEERLGFRPQVEDEGAEQAKQAESELGSESIRLLQESGDLAPGFAGKGYATVKRAIDILGSLSLMIVLSPLIVLAAVLVAIDLGNPIIFWQVRPGLHGVPFRLYKFRTMRARHDDQYTDRKLWKKKDAQRMTTVGRFLRRTRLDELPQLYHILVGEMSFVGPRPLLTADQPEDGRIRLLVRPGVTGWAQIHGGDLLSPEEKLALDVQYLNNMSLRLDIEILVRTVLVALKGDQDDNREAVDQARRELEGMRRRAVEERRRDQDLAA